MRHILSTDIRPPHVRDIQHSNAYTYLIGQDSYLTGIKPRSRRFSMP